jgi:hypothetical protein
MKCALVFERTKSTHNNQLEMALEDGGGAVVALENGGCTTGDAALGSGSNRRTCKDGIGVSVTKAEGLLLQRWRQHQQGQQERMLPMQGMDIGSNGKEIGVLQQWWRWQWCGYIESVDEARVRGRWCRTSTGKARAM